VNTSYFLNNFIGQTLVELSR